MYQSDQYESDWHWKSMSEYAKAAQRWIESLKATPSAVAIGTLIKSFEEMGDAYYHTIAQKLPESDKSYHLFAAVEKLAEEWMRIVPIIQAAAVSADPSLDVLTRVIHGALENLQFSLVKQIAVVPHFGRHFELVQFHYAPNVAVVGVPVFNLQTPWEWSVIWHELASLLVVQETVQQMILEFLKDPSDSIWKTWETRYRREVEPREVVSEPAAISIVPAAAESGEIGEPAIDPQGWLEEWVEDACSVLALGPAAYQSLMAVFKQRYTDLAARTDTRHPVPELRLEVAYRLLMHMAGENSQAQTEVRSIKQDHGRAESDKGAAKIADWIWENRAKLVVAAFDWNGEARNKLSPPAQLAHGIVIKARKQIKDHPDQGEEIWQKAQSELVNRGSSSAQAQEVESASPVKVESQAGAYISKEIQGRSLEELQKLVLSETDYLSVSATYHNHGGNPAVNFNSIGVSVSGWEHGYYHSSGTYWIYSHRH